MREYTFDNTNRAEARDTKDRCGNGHGGEYEHGAAAHASGGARVGSGPLRGLCARRPVSHYDMPCSLLFLGGGASDGICACGPYLLGGLGRGLDGVLALLGGPLGSLLSRIFVRK